MTSTPRILHVTDFFPPTAGGVERVCSGLCRALRDLGWQVHVLTPEPGAGGDLPIPEGVQVHRFEVSRKGAVRHYRSMVAGARSAFSRLVEHSPPDLIHSHLTLTTAPILSLAAERLIPMVATFYGPWFWEYRFQVRRLNRQDPLHRIKVECLSPFIAACMLKAQEAVLDQAGAVVALSRYSLKELGLLGWLPGRGATALIPGGVDPDRFRPFPDRALVRKKFSIPQHSKLLVSIRRLVPRMGLENLVKATALLAGNGRDIRLLIGGEGPLAQSLEALAGRLGISQRLVMAGRIPDDGLPATYAAADLFVMPTTALEGFGLPVVEAWACGVPVVGSPAAAVGELISGFNPKHVAASSRPEDMALVIERTLAEDGEALGRRCLERSKSHHWHVIAERYDRLYRRVMAKRAPAREGGR